MNSQNRWPPTSHPVIFQHQVLQPGFDTVPLRRPYKRNNKRKPTANCPYPHLHQADCQAGSQRSLYLFRNPLKPRPPFVGPPSLRACVSISNPLSPRTKTRIPVSNSIQKKCNTHNRLISDRLAPALLQTPTRSLHCRLVTESSSSDNEDYSQLISGAYPDEPTQPTTPLIKPLVLEAQFSDLYPPAQQPHQLPSPSPSPCPPDRYLPLSPPRLSPAQALNPLEFEYPSSDFELECPSPDVGRVKTEEDSSLSI